MGSAASSSVTKSEIPSSCPMHKTSPDNNIPTDLDNRRISSLSTEREISSIPRYIATSLNGNESACPVNHASTSKDKDENARWVYPSPQQFQSALARKGKEAPEESVSMIVDIHNFLNERAWQEIVRLEDSRLFADPQKIELARFTGRPQDLSPKARFHLALGKLFPSSYNSEPPFDRHDWYIRRSRENTIQRYVIDYYSAPEESGNPVFSLDVRQALDSPTALFDRITEWGRMKRASLLPS